MSAASDHALAVFVRKLEWIAPLAQAERDAVHGLPVVIRACEPGQELASAGDQPTRCCIVLEGWVCAYAMVTTGTRQILAFHFPGDVPDLQGLHLRVADYSLGALTRARVAFVPHDSVLALAARFPALAAALWRTTVVDAAVFRKWVVALGRLSARGRTAHLLCELFLKQRAAGLCGPDGCPFPLTQIDLSDALGVSNVHTNRVLQDLRASGLITLQRRRLDIHDWPRLCAEAEFDPAYLHLAESG